MSGLIMPVLAIGGIVILGNYLTKKTKKHKHRQDDSSSSSVSSMTHNPKRRKSKKKELNTASILKVKKSKKKDLSTGSLSLLRVKKSKSKSKKTEITSKRKVSVFYKIGSKRGQNWRYHKLPKGWVLKQKKDVNIANYSKEVDFEGPKSERDNMIKYLEKVFSYLKKKDIVNNYKIQKVKRKSKK